MANNIVIRTAKKDYVCDCCNRIIHAGEEYLDKVILNDGKRVRHERYHDECPRDSTVERAFRRIVACVDKEKEPMPVKDRDGKVYSLHGIEWMGGFWYARISRDGIAQSVDLFSFIRNYTDYNGNPVC